MKKSNRRKSNPALNYDDSDSDYEDFAPPQKKRASSHKKREKISPTWKEEEEIEGFTISTLDSPNGSDSKEIHNKHPRENEEEASEGIAALLGLASEDVIHKKPHKNIFTDPAYSSSESEAKSKESRKHRKALVPVTYTYASSDEDYNSEVYEIEEEEDIEEDLVLENDEAEYQPYSQRTMKKKEKEKVRTPKRSSIKPKRTVKKRTHYPDDSESSEFSSPPPPSSSSISSISTTNTTRTVPINPPPPIPTHLPGTVPVVDNNVASILNNDLSKPMIKTSPMSPSSSKKSSSFPTILPGSHHLSNSRSGWRRGATHVAIAQYIYNLQRQDPKQQHLIHSNGFNGNTHYGNGNHSMNGGTSKMSGIDPTLESKIFKEHAANYSKSPTLHHQQQQQQQPRNTPSSVSNRQMPMSNYPPPKFPPPPPFSPNTKHFTNSFPGNPFPPPFQNSNGSPFPFPPPQSGYPGPQFQQFPPFPGNSPNYFQPYNSPLPQQHQPQASSEPKTTIKMIPYSVHHIHHKRPRSKKDPIAASTSNLQLPPPLAPPPLQSRDFTLRPLNLKR